MALALLPSSTWQRARARFGPKSCLCAGARVTVLGGGRRGGVFGRDMPARGAMACKPLSSGCQGECKRAALCRNTKLSRCNAYAYISSVVTTRRQGFVAGHVKTLVKLLQLSTARPCRPETLSSGDYAVSVAVFGCQGVVLLPRGSALWCGQT